MKSSSVAVVGCLLAVACPWLQQSASPPAAAPVRVGVYDSRGIAIAYANSKHNERFMKEKQGQVDEAKRAGDEARVREINESMSALQQQFHEMGFSRADVSSLIDPVRDQLQKVADSASVDLIVSKWQLEYQREGTTLVNVTDAMVELYEPNDRTRTWARQIQEKEPVSAEEARRGH